MVQNLNIIQQKIFFSLNDFESQLEIWKKEKQQLVFTNGCFDIMHLGHVDYLSKAADLGTKLIVGLNSDASTKNLKGPTRPICNQKSRAGLLAALFFVDAVILFDEQTPINLISRILPDVLVKGADYNIDQIVGAKEVLANGGEVKTISFLEGYSTSSIEQKILKAHQ
ncbi:D-glycero-beta-D-manno-heptose 1-phosphate adenylyltransferase [Pedobacter sp. SD-b]|uniref:D-glycero-beta-D-manno-heptose 1-phosphate adenylyltransferase n=1 Tax=Pedobacter segetis TaxID=2793069 RepID=A0ABS1BH75_9SPHI|nr:D-glycero-beta-D-manno-heptose 1-phosphate adenylyltransferase [Pedobacter segetis]MBK0382208.1 D-glycero-beta-D-manno-heptose 1-phosphate adenylyltransferase [Pedobacter segetis]